ncbi:peptidoglycan/LPS O-acetylase OafA/YrhL [Humibacillus xanthopallidus]|uniref:Peptidoglycan/LPS O-acetylase OafA/YrhL n=1 Tax=Humibacillus xanthopallidus TaxID=412689 RepID=A0A543PXH9_9MICO|nr:acyltransferase [Humibacillus xanthopallidus]TQN48787.1 peptidoglycan/LPS O-acetylase OafA/YrhL [Humibacillus xanthopallidus]
MPSAGSVAPLKSRHIPSLDGLRTVSIVIVFIGHAGLPQVLRDQTGVTIFFFLSGYLITTLLMREQDKTGKISLTGFYLRRVFRILPAMYTVLAVAIAISAFQILESTMTPLGAIASMFQLTNYWIIIDGRGQLPTGMNALWSLNVEEHYYLLFPVLLIAISALLKSRRRQALVLAALCGLFLVWRIVLVYGLHAPIDRIYLATDTRGDSILWGAVFALAWNPVRGRAIAGGRWPWAQFILGVALLGVARILPSNLSMTFGYTIEAMALVFIFTAVISGPDTLMGRVLNWKPIAFLGVLSYSMYLCHRLILMLVAKYLTLGIWGTAAVSLVLTIGVSYLIYRLVEQPMLRLGRRYQPHLDDRTISLVGDPVGQSQRPPATTS